MHFRATFVATFCVLVAGHIYAEGPAFSQPAGGDSSFYVNGAIGNDGSRGTSKSSPKKTIQGAISAIGQSVKGNVTINVADGVYREEVDFDGIAVKRGKLLTLRGDAAWSPAMGGSPRVRITGSNSDVLGTMDRPYCLTASQSSWVVVRGFLFDHAAVQGVLLQNGIYGLYNCKLTENGSSGIQVDAQTHVDIGDTLSTGNAGSGFVATNSSRLLLHRCIATFNSGSGAVFHNLASGEFWDSGDYSWNLGDGISVSYTSNATFMSPFAGVIEENSGFGVSVSYQSFLNNFGTPGQIVDDNASGNLLLANDGKVY